MELFRSESKGYEPFRNGWRRAWQLVASAWKFVALCLSALCFLFLLKLIEMRPQKLLHVRFLVIDLMPEHPVFQRPRIAVTLDGTLACIEQLAQALIVEQPFPVEVFHLL